MCLNLNHITQTNTYVYTRYYAYQNIKTQAAAVRQL